MPRNADQLAAEALELPPDERAWLAEALMASLDEDTDLTEIEREWLEEVDRRGVELDVHPGLVRPAVDVFDVASWRLRERRRDD
jgi:putative addiction module component (TIGR02574 family)